MITLKQGWRGADVRRLQEALNRKLLPSPALATDGDYGPLTRAAVLRLQAAHWLVEDGEAGPCTQNVAFDGEGDAPILHPVALIPPPAAVLCWAAGVAMMTRSNVQAVVARTPAELVAADGGLQDFVDTQDAGMKVDQRFAAAHGLAVRPPAPWSLKALRAALHNGPLMFDMRWDAKGYADGAGRPGHMVVIAGIRGDNDPSGRGTTLRILDPWPPNKGARSSVNFCKWEQVANARTCRVFQK
ncbi:papain-like cysteine protease family protein [Variovorax sp. GB1P17]|uniref:papain-like cysteine protease family protein n=1 Tax=Variovorax sp. GB1P17 TaxID=3443740 RepID=UPI003F4602F0